MNQKVKGIIWQVTKEHWVWVLIILLLLFAILFNFSLGLFWIAQTLIITPWGSMLLGIGAAAVIFHAIGAKRKIWEGKAFQDLGTLFFIIAMFLAIRDFGFWRGIVFAIGMLIVSQFLKWLTPSKKVLKRIA